MVNFALMYPLMDPSLLRLHPAKSAIPLSKNNARPKRSRYVSYSFILIWEWIQDDTTTHKEQLSSRLLVHTKKLWLSQPQKQLTSVAALLTIDNFLRLFLQHFGVCGMGDDDDNDCVCRVTQSKKITLFLHYYPITNFPHVFFVVANLVFFDDSEGYFSHF